MAPFEWTWPNVSSLSRVFFSVNWERVCLHWSVIQCKVKAINRSLRKTITKNMAFFFISYLLLTIRFIDALSNGFQREKQMNWTELGFNQASALAVLSCWHLYELINWFAYMRSIILAHPQYKIQHRSQDSGLENLKIAWTILNSVLLQRCHGSGSLQQCNAYE